MIMQKSQRRAQKKAGQKKRKKKATKRNMHIVQLQGGNLDTRKMAWRPKIKKCV